MGMFDFLKGIFKAGKEAEKVEIGGKRPFDEAEKWVDESTKERVERFNSSVEEHFRLIKEGIEEIKMGLMELKNFNLEKELNERAKTMIIQNRDNYIKYAERLIDFFRNSISSKKSVKELDDFIKLSLWELDMFSRQSMRSFHISTEVIGKEFEKTLSGLKKINKEILELKKMDKTECRMIEAMKSAIFEIKGLEKISDRIDAAKKESMKKTDELSRNLEELRIKDKTVKSSEAWKKRLEMEENLELLEREQQAKHAEIKSLFLSIEKLIQKYSWKEKKKDILKYIEDPVFALKEDEGLKIIDELESIRTEIEKNAFTTDEKKKDIFLKNVDAIEEKKLLDFLESDLMMEDAIRKAREDIKKLNVEAVNFDEVEQKMKEANEDIAKMDKKKKAVMEEMDERKKSLSLLMADVGSKIGKQIKVNL